MRVIKLTEFLKKNYEGIMKQENGIANTIRSVLKEERYALDDKRLVVLLGAGDSYAVADFGRWAFLSVFKNAIAISATELPYLKLDEGCLVIGITASGRSLATIAALEMAKEEGAATIVLTDNPEGSANETADRIWLTKSGVDTYNISPTAPTTCAMAYLLKIAEMVHAIPRSRLHNDAYRLTQNGPDILKWAKNVGPMIAGQIRIDKPLYFVSEGPNYIAAQLGMMKFNEHSLVKGIAAFREEFQHHWNLSIIDDDQAIFITDSPTTEKDSMYLDVMTKTLHMQTYHLHAPDELHLESALGQSIANTIALQMAMYHYVKTINPQKERFKLPHAEAFKIY